MNAAPSCYDPLLTAAADGALVLTANRRLARHLGRLFEARMLAQGRQAWPAPAIFSAETWQAEALATLDEGWRLLPDGAAQRLWEEIVAADSTETGSGLLQVAISARHARVAHELLTDYLTDCAAYPLTDDHRAFLRWRQRFRAACLDGDWLDPAGRTDLVIEALAAGRLKLPGTVFLVGYDELPPSLMRLEAVAIGSGSDVREVPAPTAPAGRLCRIACRDAADEVRQAARWARGLIEAGEESIGVVVPDPAAYQSLLERIFREEIAPDSLLSCSNEELRFNLTLGSPLGQQGPAAAALELLSVGHRLALEEASYLLRTPYLAGSMKEAEPRALLDCHLRSLRSEVFSIQALQALADGGDNAHRRASLMAAIFRSLSDAQREKAKRLPGEWAVHFTELLKHLGWPGERPLDSHDFQVVKTWKEKLIREYCSLDTVCRPMSRGEAVSLLRRMAGESLFQPETPDTGLQVCGVLEAGGLVFDHLWVLGLHAEAWPPPARPNPFLPIPLQSACGMPHADAARELSFAGRVMERLQAAAPSVIFSHPLQQGDCLLRPSPLIAGLVPGAVPLAPTQAPQQLLQASAPRLDSLLDRQGAVLGEGEIALGGTAILKDQALCPFRAYAHHRLAARALDQPAPGIDPATRGALIHKVLELFWRRMVSHAALCQLDAFEIQVQVAECVEAAIRAQYPEGKSRPEPALLEIEMNRLQRLAEEWLIHVERERVPFITLEPEQEHLACFGGLNFRTKIDRVDTLADGRQIIIDYKTGRVDLDDLIGQRLLEPQLPIYGIGAKGAQLAAVAIGALRRGECSLKGVAQDDDILPKTAAFAGSKLAEKHGLADWEELLGGWRSRLESLGRDFAAGVASVDPVDVQKACRTCDLAPLCRVGEASGPVAGEGEEI